MALSRSCGITISLLFLSLSCGLSVSAESFDSETRAETERLLQNRRMLAMKRIDLLPVPKHITFTETAEPDKINIVIGDGTPCRAVILEELTSRFEELGLAARPSVSTERAAGAYNIMIADWNENTAEAKRIPFNKNPRFDQAYTLTPVKNGMILSGRRNALYAAVTMRYLIVNEKGKAVIHSASISDWPDFAQRGTTLKSQHVLVSEGKDPETYMERIKPFIRFMLHHKINQCDGLVHDPYYPNDRQRPDPLASAKVIENTRLAADYAAERGIRIGFLGANFMLGSSIPALKGRDSSLPEFQKMMHVKVHQGYTSWGRLDMHKAKALKFAKYISDTGTGHYNVHAVDTGGAVDPELWSQRDELTKKLFGNDRVKADAAVFKTYFDEVKDPGVLLSVSQYPYSAYLLDPEGVRLSAGLPNNPEGTEKAQEIARRNIQYLRDLNKALDKRILFCIREDSTPYIDLFFKNLPGRGFELAWYTFDHALNTGSLVEPDVATVRSAFRKEREVPDMLVNRGVSGNELAAPAHVLFSEFAWNSAYPGCHEIDASRRSAVHDGKMLDLLSERISSGFFGEQAGRELKPMFDNLFSFYLTVAPSEMAAFHREGFNLTALMQKNHAQLLKADKAFDAVWARVKKAPDLKKTFFKPGSYVYFIEFYRMLKAAKIHSAANLGAMEINAAAARGDLEKTEEICKQAGKEIARYKAEYREKMAELGNEPVRLTFKESPGWFHTSPLRMTARLLSNDFSAPDRVLNTAWVNRQKTFESTYTPQWYRDMKSRQITLEFPQKGENRITSWCTPAGIPAPRKIEVALSRDGDGLIFKGRLRNSTLESIPVNPNADIWGKNQDTFEVFCSPDATGSRYYQFAFNQDGVKFAAEYARPRKDSKPVALPFEVKTQREAGAWTFTMKIPYKIIGAITGRSRCMLGIGTYYTGKAVKGKTDFHDVGNWNYIVCTRTAVPAENQVSLSAGQVRTEDKVHASGAGTAVSLRPELSCTLPVDNAALHVRIMSPDGRELAPWRKVAERPFVPCVLKSSHETEIQLGIRHAGFIVELKGEYEFAGRKYTRTSKIAFGRNDKNIPGLSFDVPETLNLRNGTVSFDFVPGDILWKNYHGPNRNVWLFHAGIRNSSPAVPAWRNRIVLGIDRRFASAYLLICDNAYQSRRVFFNLPASWKSGVKQHIECRWDMRTAPVVMRIALNGEQLSGPVCSKSGEDSSTLDLPAAEYEVRIGSANNGTMACPGTFSNISLK